MAGAAATILEYKVILGMDPCAEDGGTKRWRYLTASGLSIFGFILRDRDLTSMFAEDSCSQTSSMH